MFRWLCDDDKVLTEFPDKGVLQTMMVGTIVEPRLLRADRFTDDKDDEDDIGGACGNDNRGYL